MIRLISTGLILASLVLIQACASKKDEKAELTAKKTQLAELKAQHDKLTGDIKKLEDDIAKLDPTATKANPLQVATAPVITQDFKHFIDLQGRIDAEDISYVTPRGMGGMVKELFVKKGDNVRKGQLLLKLDDAILQQNLKQLSTQLDFARNIYQRQKNLWDQGIGTEVQYLTSKNNVDALEKQIGVLKEQLSTSNVYAEVTGIADEVNIRVGETFTGNPAMGIKIVNTSRLKAVVDIPENYLSRVSKGTKVLVQVPDLSKKYDAVITLIGQSINPNSRGFMAEARIPYDGQLKPFQVALVKIQDYSAPNAIAVPVNLVQTDDKGKYVFVVEKNGEKTVARKKQVILGESYNGLIEVKTGLAAGDQLVTDGYQTLYEGQLITVATK